MKLGKLKNGKSYTERYSYKDIARGFRCAYREGFMRPSLEDRELGEGEEFDLSFSLDHPSDKIRIPGLNIGFCFEDELPDFVFAVNMIHAEEVAGVIVIDPMIRAAKKYYKHACLGDDRNTVQKRKSLLANEWLKLLYVVLNIARPRMRLVGENAQLLELMASDGFRPTWQDTDDEFAIMEPALKDLLVSDNTIKKYIEEDIPVKDVYELGESLDSHNADQAEEAKGVVHGLAYRISLRICVEEEYVRDCIYRVLRNLKGRRADPVVWDLEVKTSADEGDSAGGECCD